MRTLKKKEMEHHKHVVHVLRRLTAVCVSVLETACDDHPHTHELVAAYKTWGAQGTVHFWVRAWIAVREWVRFRRAVWKRAGQLTEGRSCTMCKWRLMWRADGYGVEHPDVHTLIREDLKTERMITIPLAVGRHIHVMAASKRTSNADAHMDPTHDAALPDEYRLTADASRGMIL